MKNYLKFKRRFLKKIKIGNLMHVSVLLGAVISIFYIRSLFAYFQADEWFYFTQFLPLTREKFGIFHAIYKSIFEASSISGGGHMAPVYNVIWYISNRLFGLNFLPYIILSIIFHFINSLLVFKVTKKLTRNLKLAFIASIFFAASYVHQQAVTWIMAFATEVSVIGMLSALYFLLNTDVNKKSYIHELRIAFSLFIFAVFAKEIAVILFIIFPYTWRFIKKMSLKGIFLKYYSILLGLYLSFRILVPLFLMWLERQVTNTPDKVMVFDIPLMVYRMVIYPIRLLVEVFVPAELIIGLTEYFTPYAYPHYAAEQAVRGTNYLTFVQSAGSDILIFTLGIVFITIITLYLIRLYKIDRYGFQIVLLAIIIVLSSAFPLLLIALYAPWWGYVIFIDSRHIYIASTGAAIIFAYFINDLSRFISYSAGRTSFRKLSYNFTAACLILVWLLSQFILMNLELNKQVKTGSQRRKIINYINSQTLPRNKTVILVTSDTGYYGFGPIPPFQTNLGQILSVYFYEQRNLPRYFINSNFLTKNGIAGEGYKEFEGKGFGYYISKDTLMLDIRKGVIKPDFISAYQWNGLKENIINITDLVRKEAYEYKKYTDTFANWIEYSDDEFGFYLKYPENMILEDKLNYIPGDANVVKSFVLNSQTDPLSISITLRKKPIEIPFSEYISLMLNSDGEEIGKSFTFRNITMLTRNTVTTVYPLTGIYPKYFIPFKDNSGFFEVTIRGSGLERKFYDAPGGIMENYNTGVEKILSTFSYEKDI